MYFEFCIFFQLSTIIKYNKRICHFLEDCFQIHVNGYYVPSELFLECLKKIQHHFVYFGTYFDEFDENNTDNHLYMYVIKKTPRNDLVYCINFRYHLRSTCTFCFPMHDICHNKQTSIYDIFVRFCTIFGHLYVIQNFRRIMPVKQRCLIIRHGRGCTI